MPAHELKLVTLFHPEVLTQLMGFRHIQEFPHRVESRELRRTRQQEFIRSRSLVPEVRFNDGISILDIGKELKLFEHHLISGGDLEPLLGDPRVVYIPDEPKPLRKWRMEFRRRWWDTDGSLPKTLQDALRVSLRKTFFAVKAVWLNPPEPFWINLVLYLPADPQRNRARLRFTRKDGLPFMEWRN